MRIISEITTTIVKKNIKLKLDIFNETDQRIHPSNQTKKIPLVYQCTNQRSWSFSRLLNQRRFCRIDGLIILSHRIELHRRFSQHLHRQSNLMIFVSSYKRKKRRTYSDDFIWWCNTMKIVSFHSVVINVKLNDEKDFRTFKQRWFLLNTKKMSLSVTQQNIIHWGPVECWPNRILYRINTWHR